MTDVKLALAKALSDAATQPGPWTVNEDDHGRCVVVDAHGMWVADCGPAPEDAAFIAGTRELVPQLIAEVARLRKQATSCRLCGGSGERVWNDGLMRPCARCAGTGALR